MSERRLLNTWKEIAAYLSRGVRTVQRWELNYGLPVRRAREDAQSVFAFADEIDAWMERTKPRGSEYLRPTLLVLDVMTPNALSDLKLAIEAAKFNVLTAFTAAEARTTAAKHDVDGFVIDSVILDEPPLQLAEELKRLYPAKPILLVGEESTPPIDAHFAPGDTSGVVQWLIERFGSPLIGEMGYPLNS